ncbi:nuclear transport factor 2 family protein [Mycobacterium vicinigordonae]|uniref:Nuclear transport factor 2 family protein n=1 Tax=Mycobacterium vicinigordonae TaxID=1719132 RepID=A0A7D6HQU5_9MYCO|nr:nuclear transport factor 2 family protein [Mycobacterium vicinigordonae]QLL07831.1 nuclear transport factor 2 family protein [Mycobacterium vicinigordonae]
MTDAFSAIRELLARYAFALDAHDTATALTLFTEDAEFTVYGRTFAGRGGIGRMFQEAPRGLHLLGATSIAPRGDSATAQSQVLFVNASTQQQRLAHYEDELVHRDGTWLIRRRRCRFVTSGGLSDSPEVVSL